jgi:hypothetical protein
MITAFRRFLIQGERYVTGLVAAILNGNEEAIQTWRLYIMVIYL